MSQHFEYLQHKSEWQKINKVMQSLSIKQGSIMQRNQTNLKIQALQHFNHDRTQIISTNTIQVHISSDRRQLHYIIFSLFLTQDRIKQSEIVNANPYAT
jgi:hypothetical protein